MTERIPFPDHAWPLMKRALEHIAGHPESFYMPNWVVDVRVMTGPTREEWERDITEVTGLPLPSCGTVACLGGWVVLLSESGDYPDDESALAALGLSTESGYIDGGRQYADPVSEALANVFWMEHVRTYAELCDALTDSFTFPEPLPAESVVTP